MILKHHNRPATMEEAFQKWERPVALSRKAVEPLVWAFALLLAPAGFFALASYEDHHYWLAALAAVVLSLPLIGVAACAVVFRLEKCDWWATIPTLPEEFDWDGFQNQFAEHVARS